MSEFKLGVIAGMLILFGAQAMVYLIAGMFRRPSDSKPEHTK